MVGLILKAQLSTKSGSLQVNASLYWPSSYQTREEEEVGQLKSCTIKGLASNDSEYTLFAYKVYVFDSSWSNSVQGKAFQAWKTMPPFPFSSKLEIVCKYEIISIDLEISVYNTE